MGKSSTITKQTSMDSFTDAATTDSSHSGRTTLGCGEEAAGDSQDNNNNENPPSISSSQRSKTSSRAASVNYSRRDTQLDDTEKPLDTEKQRATRTRITGILTCAVLKEPSLAGRQEEILILRRALGRVRGRASTVGSDGIAKESSGLNDGQLVAKPSSRKELVLIDGTSGSGKSRLAATIADRIEGRVGRSSGAGGGGGLFVQGKYDLYFRDEPYFGISRACGEICGHIQRLEESDAESFLRIVNELKQEMTREELRMLKNVIVPIVEIVGEEAFLLRMNSTTAVEDSSSSDLEQAKELFGAAFRKFFRIITADPPVFGGPLILCLDDLQWADAASLDLLELLLTDRESSGLMIVGCYRSEEVLDNDDAHILRKMIRGLNEKAAQGSQDLFVVTEIHLEHLTSSDVNQILMELLSIDDVHKTMPLANLCYKRTKGNPFHLMTFLHMLQEEHFLEFNVGSFRWIFDVEKIERKTSATFNVVQTVISMIQKVTECLQEVLFYAACLGSSFDSETLYLVWNEMTKNSDNSRKALETYLEEAVEHNILEADVRLSKYRWVHDKVQEAAMTLAHTASGDDIQFSVGRVLLDKFQDNQLDGSIVFVIANLLQSGNLSSLNERKRLEVVKINLKAATKSVACSAFKSAAKYVKNGVELLPDDAFKRNYDLAMELYSLGAEAEGCIGNDFDMSIYCDGVISHATNPLDKIRCYNVQLSRLGNTQKTRVAVRLCEDILDELGTFKIPRNSLAQKVKAVMALRKIKDVQLEILHALPLMEDHTQLATIHILNRVTSYATLSGDTFLLILASCAMFNKTLKHGLCPLSTSAFTTIAVVRDAMGNFQGGKVFCDQALSLLPRLDSKSDLSRTYFISYFFVKTWTMPFKNCLKYLQEAYKAGIESGDTESGCWGIAMYIMLSIHSGTSLNSIITDIQNYYPQIKDLRRDEQALHLQIYFQACLCFMGLSDNPTEMSGEVILNAEKFECELRSFESKIALMIFQSLRSFLCCIFGDHAKGAELALERGNAYFRITAGCPPAMHDTFHRGVSLFDMARRMRRAKYKRAAKKTLSTMKRWVKCGNPNVVHMLKVLESERFALSRDKEKACVAYEKGITLSIRCGILQDAALANERYGEYLLNEIKDPEKAMHYFEKAIIHYKDWGALAKVDQLNDKYSKIGNYHAKLR